MPRPDIPVAVCRSCKRAIYWAFTDKGRRMPLDVAEVTFTTPKVWELSVDDDGTPRAREFSPLLPAEGCTLHVPHWATCPDADEWRNRK